MDLKKLQEPFPVVDIEWRIGQAGKSAKGPYAKVLAYLTNRAIMQRLDDVCGPENWRNEYKAGPAGGIICGISIYVAHTPTVGAEHEWVTKWDGAENTDIESVKGGLSDAMKRAAVQWGIGRYLYNLGETFAECSEERKPGWNYAKSKEGVFYWKTPNLPSWALPNDELPNLKLEIWNLCGQNLKKVDEATQKAGVKEIKTVADAKKVINFLLDSQ